jgi:hypothetical protein
LIARIVRRDEVHDDGGTGERVLERCRIADVAAPVLELRPPVLERVERPPGDADDPRDPRVGLQTRHQPEAECSGRTGDRHRETSRRHDDPQTSGLPPVTAIVSPAM